MFSPDDIRILALIGTGILVAVNVIQRVELYLLKKELRDRERVLQEQEILFLKCRKGKKCK